MAECSDRHDSVVRNRTIAFYSALKDTNAVTLKSQSDGRTVIA